MTRRPKLFAGIALDDRTRAAIAQVAARLEAQNFPARFEQPEKLHVTLAFLGWVDLERLGEITSALRTAAASCERFGLSFDKIGAFPNERNPRVAWVGCRDQGAPFRSVAQSLRSAYEELGFTFTSAPVAHVTVARVKAPRAHLPLLEVQPIPLRVSELTLFESIPAGKTTAYEVRATAALQGEAHAKSE